MILTRFLNLAVLRKLIQGSFTLFSLFIGFRFYQYYLWMSQGSTIPVQRPPSVEGFLPISALVSFKKLLLTGVFDEIHPAGLTIFLAAMSLAFFLRKGFCGWICPVGFVSNGLWEIREKLRSIADTPLWINYPLLSLKYALLGFFGFMVLWKMDIASLEGFLRSPYNVVVDAKMLFFFLQPSPRALLIMVGLLIFSLAIRNFWCRFLCPYGALLGLFSTLSPTTIKRDSALCIDCKRCEKKCPSGIRVTKKETIRTPECLGCLACIETCPVEDCLHISFWNRSFPPLLHPILALSLFMLFYIWAYNTGHWQQNIDISLLKQYYKVMFQLKH